MTCIAVSASGHAAHITLDPPGFPGVPITSTPFGHRESVSPMPFSVLVADVIFPRRITPLLEKGKSRDGGEGVCVCVCVCVCVDIGVGGWREGG